MSEEINTKPKGVKRFRVYFGEEKSYYTVYIFKTREEMSKWVNAIHSVFNGKDIEMNFGALTHPWSVLDKDGNWIKDIGFIAFCEPYLWNYVIAHELTHATTEWFFRSHDAKEMLWNDNDGEGQEYFAWTLGEAFKQVMKKLGRDK